MEEALENRLLGAIQELDQVVPHPEQCLVIGYDSDEYESVEGYGTSVEIYGTRDAFLRACTDTLIAVATTPEPTEDDRERDLKLDFDMLYRTPTAGLRMFLVDRFRDPPPAPDAVAHVKRSRTSFGDVCWTAFACFLIFLTFYGLYRLITDIWSVLR